jgi:glutamine amidotransferase
VSDLSATVTAKHVAVIDYGMGNLHSVASALAHVAPDLKISVTSDAALIDRADHIIFPGVGAIRDCMAEIRRLKCDQMLDQALAEGKPILGICVGMQSLMQRSEENGGVNCLGLMPGTVKFFLNEPAFAEARDEGSASGERLKVPHMGWNQVQQSLPHPLWHNIPQHSRFYFVHSYYVQTPKASLVAGGCHYGIDFAAALAQDNLFAVQFHPEKSHTAGLQLLRNFVNWDGTL